MDAILTHTEETTSKKIRRTLLELAEGSLNTSEGRDLISIRGIEKVKSRLTT